MWRQWRVRLGRGPVGHLPEQPGHQVLLTHGDPMLRALAGGEFARDLILQGEGSAPALRVLLQGGPGPVPAAISEAAAQLRPHGSQETLQVSDQRHVVRRVIVDMGTSPVGPNSQRVLRR